MTGELSVSPTAFSAKNVYHDCTYGDNKSTLAQIPHMGISLVTKLSRSSAHPRGHAKLRNLCIYFCDPKRLLLF